MLDHGRREPPGTGEDGAPLGALEHHVGVGRRDAVEADQRRHGLDVRLVDDDEVEDRAAAVDDLRPALQRLRLEPDPGRRAGVRELRRDDEPGDAADGVVGGREGAVGLDLDLGAGRGEVCQECRPALGELLPQGFATGDDDEPGADLQRLGGDVAHEADAELGRQVEAGTVPVAPTVAPGAREVAAADPDEGAAATQRRPLGAEHRADDVGDDQGGWWSGQRHGAESVPGEGSTTLPKRDERGGTTR